MRRPMGRRRRYIKKSGYKSLLALWHSLFVPGQNRSVERDEPRQAMCAALNTARAGR